MGRDSAESLFQSLLQEALCEHFWRGHGCPLFDVVHPEFPLPTTASPTDQDALKDGFGEAVVACDVPEPCTFPSLDHASFRLEWKRRYSSMFLHLFAVVPPIKL